MNLGKWGQSILMLLNTLNLPKPDSSSPIIVGVIDSAPNLSHPQLTNYMQHGSHNLVGSNQEGQHGTHIAGIIAGINENPISPSDLQIIPVKIGDDPTTGTTPKRPYLASDDYIQNIIDAITWLEAKKTRTINMSFGYEKALNETKHNELKNLMGNSSMLFVAAAGNDRLNISLHPMFPASFDLPNVIAVAAVDRNGNLASFSNYGNSVDIGAPGVDINSTAVDYADKGKDIYKQASGTSMAAPFVINRLVNQLLKNGSLTNTDLKDMLKDLPGLTDVKGKSQPFDILSFSIVTFFNLKISLATFAVMGYIGKDVIHDLTKTLNKEFPLIRHYGVDKYEVRSDNDKRSYVGKLDLIVGQSAYLIIQASQIQGNKKLLAKVPVALLDAQAINGKAEIGQCFNVSWENNALRVTRNEAVARSSHEQNVSSTAQSDVKANPELRKGKGMK